MMSNAFNRMELSSDGARLTVNVPFAIRQRGGRKVIISPAGEQECKLDRPRIDSTLTAALGRAFRWKAMLDRGAYSTVSELAAAEKLDRSFVSRVLRLTLLSPDLVDAILEGNQPATLQLQPLMRGFPLEWTSQTT